MKTSRKIKTYLAALVFTVMLVALTACGSTTGPAEQAEPEPDIPNVAGNWAGIFDGLDVSMSLSQTEKRVTGVLAFRATQYDIEGGINSVDRLDVFNRLDHENCTVYSSFRGLGLSADGKTLQGQMVRVRLVSPCSGPNPKKLSEYGEVMQFTRN